MLDTLTSKDFEPLLNDKFEVLCNGDSISLTLSALDVMDERYSSPGARRSFSLTFLGPLSPLLTQALYTLRHETLGDLELLMVPLGAVEGGQCYEIILN